MAENEISQLEDYKAAHGSYPPESDVRLPKEDMFYMRTGDGYKIGFSVGFDESYWYDSRTKRWSFDADDRKR